MGLWAARRHGLAGAWAVPLFLIGALKGAERRDASGGDFAASFTFVEDVADGLLAAARAQTLDHDIYHLGPGRNFSAREVAEAVKSAVPSAVIELGPGTLPWTTYTALRGPLAGERLRQDTGYEVDPSLEDGIRAYADWLRATPSCTGSRDAVLAATDEASELFLRRRGVLDHPGHGLERDTVAAGANPATMPVATRDV